MGEEFYAIIKLISGEEIFSIVCIDENDGDPVVILSNPVIIKYIHTAETIMVKIKPWIDLSDDDFFILRQDKIITMTETKNKNLIGMYNNYISNDLGESSFTNDLGNGRVKVSNKMGYISSVENAKKILEKIFNNT
jgi:hypothetical protein